MTDSAGNRVSLSVGNWIALIALGVTPAMGFASWAWTTSMRLAVMEANHAALSTTAATLDRTVNRLNDRQEVLPRIEQRLADIERRLDHDDGWTRAAKRRSSDDDGT